MNAAAQLFKDHGGDNIRVSSAGLLFLSAVVINDPTETGEQGLKNAHALIDGVLSLASENGFMQTGELRACLMRCEASQVAASLAQQACGAAGQKRVMDLFLSLPQEADHAAA
jgi:hypothetical protein